MSEVLVGIDEVGRGAWAGPLVVGAVILVADAQIEGLKDSKLLSLRQRERLVPQIQAAAISWAIGIVEVWELDAIGLGASLGLAAQRAIDCLRLRPTKALVDGKYPFRNVDIEQQPIIGGDRSVPCISAASVIAKVMRDQVMRELHDCDHQVQPFRFDLNKGYPSALHRAMLATHGPLAHHRRSFAPIRALLKR